MPFHRAASKLHEHGVAIELPSYAVVFVVERIYAVFDLRKALGLGVSRYGTCIGKVEVVVEIEYYLF